jgi:hypothetical protein
MPPQTLELLLDFALPALLAIPGLLLLRRATKSFRLKPHPRCANCHYDLRAATSTTCPECGHTTQSPRQLNHGKLRPLPLLLGSLLILPALFVLSFAILVYSWAYPRQSRINQATQWTGPNLDHFTRAGEFGYPDPPLHQKWAIQAAFWAWGIDLTQTLAYTTHRYTIDPYITIVADQLSLDPMFLNRRHNVPTGYIYTRYLIHQTLKPIEHYSRYVSDAMHVDTLTLQIPHHWVKAPWRNSTPSPADPKLFSRLHGIHTLNLDTNLTDDVTLQTFALMPDLKTINIQSSDPAFLRPLAILIQSPTLQSIQWTDPTPAADGTRPMLDPQYDTTLATILATPSLKTFTLSLQLNAADFSVSIAALKARTTPLTANLTFLDSSSRPQTIPNLISQTPQPDPK